MEAIQKVIDNLNVSKIEARGGEDSDTAQFLMHKEVEPLLILPIIEIELIDRRLKKVLQLLLNKLRDCINMEESQDVPSQVDRLSSSVLERIQLKFLENQENYRQLLPETHEKIPDLIQNIQSLFSCRRILLEQGIPKFSNAFYEYTNQVVTDIRTTKVNPYHRSDLIRKELVQKTELKEVLDAIRYTGINTRINPKLVKVEEILTVFFDSEISKTSKSKVLVFTNNRVSAIEIVNSLNKLYPLISARVFIGQACRNGVKGMDQTEQQATIKDFNSNQFNVMVATSVGEEGLDIGEVDLVICFDSGLTPIRMIQRAGRTARRRRGRVLLLLLENEYRMYQSAHKKYLSLISILTQNSVHTKTKEKDREYSFKLYPFNSLMVPEKGVPKLKYVSYQGLKREAEEQDSDEDFETQREEHLDSIVEGIIIKSSTENEMLRAEKLNLADESPKQVFEQTRLQGNELSELEQLEEELTRGEICVKKSTIITIDN